MSSLVKGVLVFRCIPLPSEGGVTVLDIVSGLGIPRRNVERILATFERHGLIVREHGRRGPRPWGYPARWWRA